MKAICLKLFLVIFLSGCKTASNKIPDSVQDEIQDPELNIFSPATCLALFSIDSMRSLSDFKHHLSKIIADTATGFQVTLNVNRIAKKITIQIPADSMKPSGALFSYPIMFIRILDSTQNGTFIVSSSINANTDIFKIPENVSAFLLSKSSKTSQIFFRFFCKDERADLLKTALTQLSYGYLKAQREFAKQEFNKDLKSLNTDQFSLLRHKHPFLIKCSLLK